MRTAENSASAPIWAHTVGYAPRLRGGKPLAFLKAFIDDSASERGERHLFLAGYLNNADNWERFSLAWDEELKTPPAIEYLKMSEAHSLREQFWGWSESDRDEKLSGLARVIQHFKPFSFQVSLSRERFNKLVRPVSARGFANPHLTASLVTVAMLSRYAAQEGVKLPIDFIFDEQDGVSADMVLFFEWMTNQLPKKARKLIAGTPIFRNDRDFLPLQAADMLAWHLRREHEECLAPITMPMATKLRSGAHLMSEVEESMMQKWNAHHSQFPGFADIKSKRDWRTVKSMIAEI